MHLDEVASVIHETLSAYPASDDKDLGSVIWLHDTLEDTDTTLEELEREFGSRVALAVFAMTGYGKTRAERWKSMEKNARMVFHKDYEAFMLAAHAKTADRIANLRNSFVNRPELYAAYTAHRTDFHLFYARYTPVELQDALAAAYDLGNQQQQAA